MASFIRNNSFFIGAEVIFRATGSRPLVVYSPATEAVRDAVAERADAALQEVPRGTGDALRAALDALDPEVEDVLVLSGDVPMVDAELLANSAHGDFDCVFCHEGISDITATDISNEMLDVARSLFICCSRV